MAVLLFAWLPPYRVLMVWVYDRTESLLIAMLMHVPISVTTFVVASEASTSAALVVPVLISGAAFSGHCRGSGVGERRLPHPTSGRGGA